MIERGREREREKKRERESERERKRGVSESTHVSNIFGHYIFIWHEILAARV